MAWRRLAAVTLAAALIAAPAWPQSAGGPSPTKHAPAQAQTSPQPDKTRARKAFQAGRRAEQSGDWSAEFAAYSEAAEYDPTNREYAILKEHARFQVIQSLMDRAERQAVAGDIPGARVLLNQAIQIDPSYIVARERLAELAVSPAAEDENVNAAPRLAGLPRLAVKPGVRAFDYRGTTRGAYDEIGKQFGVTMVFDSELLDRSIHFHVPALDFDTAIMVLSLQARTLTRVVDAHTMFVALDTAQNQRDYTLEVQKELSLPASVTADEMNETVRMIREMTGIARTQLNTATHTLTVRGPEQNVALAKTLLDQIEQPRGELMLEIEILELDRTVANQLGVTPPAASSVFALTLPEIRQLQAAQNSGTLMQTLQTIFGSSAVSSASGSALPALIAFGGGKTIFLSTMPSVTANFSAALNTVRSAQRILLRAQDGKPATFFVGDRYPIDLGLLSANFSTGTAALSSTLASGLTLPRADYGTGQGPISLAVADFNQDGRPDLAVANETDGTISILLGNGDGTFQTQTVIAIPGVTSGSVTTAASPSAIVSGDFNADGRIDIAMTDMANNRVLILLGNGDGTFLAPVAYPTGSNPVALAARDFDGDGQPDLAIVNRGDGVTTSNLTILLGNKVGGTQNGTFATPPNQVSPPAVGISPSAIATAVFTTGANSDLAVTNAADKTVSILLGNGDGTFRAQTTFATGGGPAGVAAADFNSDGHADLAVSNQADGTVSILVGNGDGTFQGQTSYAAGSGPVGVIAATFAGAAMDLAVADVTGNNVDVLIGNGDGTFTAPISLPTGNSPIALGAADLNGDGTIDLATANNTSNTVTITLNTLQSLAASSAAQIGYPSAQYEDLGLKVKATPRLHAGDEVTLQLQFDIKSLAGASINGIPILSNRQIEQTIRLRENETSVLSGLLQSNDMRSTSGLPWTSTPTGIGLLTGENTGNVQQSEILILVTPRALRLPARDFPAVYAGRGEPATPPSPLPITPLPGPPPDRGPFGGAPQPGQLPGINVPPQQPNRRSVNRRSRSRDLNPGELRRQPSCLSSYRRAAASPEMPASHARIAGGSVPT